MARYSLETGVLLLEENGGMILGAIIFPKWNPKQWDFSMMEFIEISILALGSDDGIQMQLPAKIMDLD